MATKLLQYRHQWTPTEMLIYQKSVPGPNFTINNAFWASGRPTLNIFVNGRSYLLWEVLGHSQKSLAWLEQSVERWETYLKYLQLFHFINNLVVVNNPAER